MSDLKILQPQQTNRFRAELFIKDIPIREINLNVIRVLPFKITNQPTTIDIEVILDVTNVVEDAIVNLHTILNTTTTPVSLKISILNGNDEILRFYPYTASRVNSITHQGLTYNEGNVVTAILSLEVVLTPL